MKEEVHLLATISYDSSGWNSSQTLKTLKLPGSVQSQYIVYYYSSDSSGHVKFPPKYSIVPEGDGGGIQSETLIFLLL